MLKPYQNQLLNHLSQKKNTEEDIENKKNEIIIKIMDNKNILINNEECLLENFEKHINLLIKELPRKQKEKLTTKTIYISPDGDITMRSINTTLIKLHIPHIQSKSYKIITEANTISNISIDSLKTQKKLYLHLKEQRKTLHTSIKYSTKKEKITIKESLEFLDERLEFISKNLNASVSKKRKVN